MWRKPRQLATQNHFLSEDISLPLMDWKAAMGVNSRTSFTTQGWELPGIFNGWGCHIATSITPTISAS